MKQRNCALIVGMDRGGTLRTAGMLARMGFAASAIDEADSSLSGGRRSGPIGAFNEAILQAAGSHVRDWQYRDRQSPDSLWRGAEEARLRAAGAELLHHAFANVDGIVLHDATLPRLADLWLEILAAGGFAVTAFMPLCHPAQVAASLHRHDGLDPVQAHYLWLGTMLDAERHTRGHSRFIFHVADLVRDWRGTCARAPLLGDRIVPALPDSAVAAVDGWLATRPAPPPCADDADWLDPLVAETYAILAGWADGAESAADHGRLDAIGQEFARFVRFAQPLARSMETAQRRAEGALRQSRDELVQALDDIVAIGILLRNEERQCAQLTDQLTAERLAAKSTAALLEKADYLRTTLTEERLKRKDLMARMQDRDTEFRLLHEKTEQLREHKQRTEAKLAKLREQKELTDGKLTALRETSQRDLARMQSELEDRTRQRDEFSRAKEQVDSDLQAVRADRETLKTKLAAAADDRRQLERRLQQADARSTSAATILEKMAQERLAFPPLRPPSGALAALSGSAQSRWRTFCHRLAEDGLFDADEYLAANPDVATAQLDPLTHYLTRGQLEGRAVKRKAGR